jgi:hypothetical protein
MSAHNHAYSLTRSGPTGVSSFSIIAGAILTVCVLSSVPVVQQLVGSAPASTTTAATAPTRDFQARWWPGEMRPAAVRSTEVKPSEARPGELRQVNRQTATVPEQDLTFTKGYQLRLAAREATLAARPATTAPSSESRFGRPAVVRTAAAFARADAALGPRRAAAAHMAALGDRSGPLDSGSHALAFGEQRPSQHGFAGSQGGLFAGFFGNRY